VMATSGSPGLGPAGAPREASREPECGARPPCEEKGAAGHIWLGVRESGIWKSTVAGGERLLGHGPREKGA